MKRLGSAPPQFGAAPSRFSTGASSGTGFARTDGRSSTERGYGADWQRVREQVLRDEPWCREHAKRGERVGATDVDHIHRFRGLADPLRLARSNLRPLCRACHMARTARQSKGVGGV